MEINRNKRKIIIAGFGWFIIIVFLAVIFVFSNQNGEKSNILTLGILEKFKLISNDAQSQSYFKITREGDKFTGYYSINKYIWNRIEQPINLDLNQSVYVGIAAAPRKDNILCTAVFDNLNISMKNINAPEDTWHNTDIGKTGAAGGLSIVNGRYIIKASSSNVFHYMYKKVDGDFSISAKLLSVRSKDVQSKAGVVIRNSLEPDSKLVEVIMTPEGFIHFISKDDKGYYISQKQKPEYLYNKIFRKILHFTAYLILALLISMTLALVNISYRRKNIVVLVMCIILASLDECHQIFVYDRTPAITDVFIDTAGAMLGLLIINLAGRIRRRN